MNDSNYSTSILSTISRKQKRKEFYLKKKLPFFGIDIWNAYEISWLNLLGKPEIGIITFNVPANSSNMIESKSLKLYLHSFNHIRLANSKIFVKRLIKDFSQVTGSNVKVKFISPKNFLKFKIQELGGILLDTLNININHYSLDSTILATDKNSPIIKETLLSNLLKSNCPITGQPDWGTLQIHYIGKKINREALLKYIISFRTHNAFHEQCIEKIFLDILDKCQPYKLTVYGRYMRRGGIDINPWRSNFSVRYKPLNLRTTRQ